MTNRHSGRNPRLSVRLSALVTVLACVPLFWAALRTRPAGPRNGGTTSQGGTSESGAVSRLAVASPQVASPGRAGLQLLGQPHRQEA